MARHTEGHATDAVEVEKIERKLHVTLTDAEIEVKAKQLAAMVLEYDLKEEKKKEEAKAATEELKSIRTTISRTSDIIATRRELRTVECIRSVSKTHERVVRLDTGEVISEHTVIQPSLFADGDLVPRTSDPVAH